MTAQFPASPLPGLDRHLSEPEAELLDKYLLLLVKWQRAQRLVGSTQRAWLIEHVVIDSISFLGVIPRGARRLVDIGSGAGIPGVPLAIVCAGFDIVMIEAKRRRASFLSTVLRELPLPNASVVEARVEDLGSTYERRFDAALLRCAGAPGELVPRAARLVRSGGSVIASAGPDWVPRDDAGGELVTVPRDSAKRHFRVWTVQ